MKVLNDSLFESEGGSYLRLNRNQLIKGFDLSKEDSKIDFSVSSSDMASIDLEEGRKKMNISQISKVIGENREAFVQYITRLSPEAQINQLATKLARQSIRIDEVPEPQIINYIKNAIKDFSSDKISEIAYNDYYYSTVVKKKIESLIDNFTERQFNYLLESGKVICQPSFEFSKKIKPTNTIQGITKNLYIEEGEMNKIERDVIFKVASLNNVQFWHRNLERGKGFQINGFINHYPDFIVKMMNGMIVLIETKGDHLDGSDSLKKITTWQKNGQAKLVTIIATSWFLIMQN